MNLKQLGLMLVEIDFFSMIKNTYPENMIVELENEFIIFIEKNIRPDEFVLKYTNNKFLVVCKINSLNILSIFAEKLRKKIELFIFEQNIRLTCSFGIMLFLPSEDMNINYLKLEEALEKAKKNGHNCVVAV